MEWNSKHEEFTRAVYADLRRTYPQMTYPMVEKEAKSILAGNQPQGIIGVRLEDVFKQAHLM